MVKVPFQLRRRTQPGPAVALYLPSRDASALLDLCVGRGSDPLPRVYAVAGWVLLELTPGGRQALRPEASISAIRLRRLCDHLYPPADAELIPALHDDELLGLVRDRGLVFLPGGRV